jgi:hypothetical protein
MVQYLDEADAGNAREWVVERWSSRADDEEMVKS